jgi:threonine aldolase
MRQAGILAAACDYALDHHFERLALDHENARYLAQAFAHPALRCAEPPQTNIVLLDVDGGVGADRFARALREAGVWVSVTGPTRLRLVTHLDVDAHACERAATIARGLQL